MGAAKDFVAATFADALAPTLKRPVEDIIYETLDRRQIPTRTDFKELRDLINLLRGQVSGATQGAKNMAESIEDIDGLLNQLEDRDSEQRERIDALQLKVDETQNQLQSLVARLTLLEKAQSQNANEIKNQIQDFLTKNPGIEQNNAMFCKVDNCNEKSRAKGFCAKHYQKWRRGTLKGYVNHEGYIQHEGKSFHIGVQHAGEPFTVKSDGIHFDGSLLSTLG